MSAIELSAVSKRYGTTLAVDDLTVTVPVGSVYGFIGPNGSGKTTTLRMIMNIILPDAGRIAVLGSTAFADVRDRVGYLPEERSLYRKMRVRALLEYFGRLKGCGPAILRPRIDEWLSRLGLAGWGDRRIEALSKGMSQKVQFIATVIAGPELLILDEPFSGLDPVNMEAVKDAVLELRNRGATIVFSTHDMAVAERMCDRIFMIFRGRKVLDGTLMEIQERFGEPVIRVRAGAGAEVLRRLPGVVAVNDYGHEQEIRTASDPQDVLRQLVASGPVESFEVRRPSLHDIFVRIARPESEVPARG